MKIFFFSSNLDISKSLFGFSSWCGSKSASFSCLFHCIVLFRCHVNKISMFPSSIGFF
ncbi:hypothetical protein NC653_040861 [Populus alba x Populus x berolinensis]|uniref:Uncharacterized protein n=1 Tax=Populus alba x Populus x berolinensis TaxID=444605 RepID=A0AAD6L743_9ROSI|nr:hypothetical protein NC653_040861 [Populus alba x Populus x berolinensis]